MPLLSLTGSISFLRHIYFHTNVFTRGWLHGKVFCFKRGQTCSLAAITETFLCQMKAQVLGNNVEAGMPSNIVQKDLYTGSINGQNCYCWKFLVCGVLSNAVIPKAFSPMSVHHCHLSFFDRGTVQPQQICRSNKQHNMFFHNKTE